MLKGIKMIYIGIDPGADGEIAILYPEAKFYDAREEVHDCSELLANRIALVRDIVTNAKNMKLPTCALIEKVNAFYKSSAKSAFSFGGNFYAWQAILACYKIPYEFITPRMWQKSMFDSAKKQKDTKTQSVELASRLYPNIEFKTQRGRKLDGRADALLIATYLKKNNND